jgi:predicted CopG family antitoxin
MSKKIWSKLQKMWAGKSSLTDVIRTEQKRGCPGFS